MCCMFLLGLPTFEARTSRLEPSASSVVAPGHVQSNALVQLSLGESDGNHSDARAVIMDEGTQNHVGGKECGTYLIVSMQRSASTTFCHDVSLIDGPKKTHCAFELFASRHVQKHRQDEEWVRGHPKEYLRHEANESRTLGDVCVWGFKLFDSQLTGVAQIVSEVDKCIIYRCARRALSRVPSFSSLIRSPAYFAGPLARCQTATPFRTCTCTCTCSFCMNAHAHAHMHVPAPTPRQAEKHHRAVPLVENGRHTRLLGDRPAQAGGRPALRREGHRARR